MNVGEGMVAMVRGLGDRSLAVTLLDGTRKYTLMPNNAQFSNPTHIQNLNGQEQTRERVESASPSQPTRCEMPARCKSTARCESGAQATDGRYASMYKTAHCHVSPTSPAVELTEFPPQRADICHGHDNFEVGGTGSGDTYSPTRAGNNFRGGMSWTDRGSVYDPRPSHVPDAFANSLRKYPNISPERSTEMVERLISYSQSKNGKNNTRSQTSPSRASDASSSRMQKCSECETNCRTRKEESPTRESRSRKCDFDCADFRRAVFRNYDVRFFREVSKRTRDSARNLPMQNTNSVNMETQAVVEMTSKEVATVPGTHPSKRSVAVPLSPATSTVKRNSEGENRPTASYSTDLHKNVETSIYRQKKSLGQIKSVQTSSSSIQLSSPDCVCRHSYHDYRTTKSEEELKSLKRVEDSVKFNEILNSYPISKKLLSETQKVITNSHMYKTGDIQNIPVLGTESVSCKHTDDNHQAEDPFRVSNHGLETTINEWLKDIPIKNKDVLGRSINRKQIAKSISNKLKQIIFNAEDTTTLKSAIVELIEDIPIDIDDVNKKVYVSSLVHEFLQKSIQIYGLNMYKDWKNKRVGTNNNKYESSRNSIQRTEEEIKGFVSEVLIEFFEQSKFKISRKRLQDVEIEIMDVLIDSLIELNVGNDIIMKKDLFFILHEIGLISEYQAILLTDNLVERFKSFINIHDYKVKKHGYSQTFVVLQNAAQNSAQPATNITNITMGSISQRDLDACLDFYIDQLIQEIDSWLLRVLGPEVNFIREVAVNDLAGDILDRLKYLDKKPAKQVSEKEELEFMKFQIYKWINRLVSDDAVQQAIEHAPELMERIQALPVPFLSKPEIKGYAPGSPLPPCCITESTINNSEFRPEPFLNKENVGQSPTGFNLPDLAMFNAPVPSGSGIDRVVSKNAYTGSGANTAQAINMRNVATAVDNIIEPSNGIIMTNQRPYNIEPVRQYIDNVNISQMPMFGPAGAGGSMVAAPDRGLYTNRRFSLPGAFASGPTTPDMRITQMPMLNPTNYASSKPGLNMLGAKAPMSPGIRPGAEVVPEFRKYDINEMPMFGLAGKGGSMIDADSSNHGVRRMSGPGAFDLATRVRGPYQPAPGNSERPVVIPVPDPTQHIPAQLIQIEQSIDRIHAEYDQFLKNWVASLPLPVTTSKDKSLADTIRLGFYNGIWKAFLKVNLDPVKYTNRVYCQNVLDEEIQELFNLLPKTQELERKKEELKANLIKKTVHVISLILARFKALHYKQQLLEQVSNHLPNRVKLSSDFPTDRHEQVQKLQLVDTFILYTRYKEVDKVKANVYRKKLNDRVDDIFRNVKRSHKAPLVNIDMEVYKNEIINALHKVPLPTADVIKEEADEILLGIEIEKWFSDLPIVPNNDPAEQLDRRRILYAFAKQIYDINKQMDLMDDSSVDQLKIATKRFIEKLPFQENQEANVNFMVEEFINRLKNRGRENISQHTDSGSFVVPAFADFAKNVALSSSVAEVNPHVINGVDGSQYYESNRGHNGGPVQALSGYKSSQPPQSQPQRWLTLFELGPGDVVDSAMLAPFTQQSIQEAQASQHLPQQSQLAGATIGNPQQQMISESQIRAPNYVIPVPVPHIQVPEILQPSFRGSMPFDQDMKTNKAAIVQEGQAVVVSGSPNPQKSNRIIFNIPEIRISPPSIMADNQQVGRTSIAPARQIVPDRPVGILGTSQIAGSSGRPPILRAPNAPTVVPNINIPSIQSVNEPIPGQHEQPQVVLNPPSADLQPAQPVLVSAPSVPIQRDLQNLSAPQNPVPSTGNFYMSNQLPVAYSTPQQSQPPRDAPPKLERKRPRELGKRLDGVRKRLDFEDSEESDSDEIQCRCMERVYRCRRRRPYYDCDDYNMMDWPRYFPVRYPHPYFF